MKKPLGFTLIELLIYLGLIIIVASIVTAFLPNLLKSYSFAQKKEEVVDSTQRALAVITQELRHASAIYTPTSILNTNPGQLSLSTSHNPPEGESSTYLDFYLDNERLYLKKEGQTAELLMPDKIRIANLTFSQLTSTSTIPALRITIRATYDSDSTEIQERTQTTLTTTASLRSY